MGPIDGLVLDRDKRREQIVNEKSGGLQRTTNMADVTRYAEFFAQPVSLFGLGARRKLVGHLRAFAARRVLVCTDKGIVTAGIADELTTILRHTAQLDVVLFDGVVANPTEACVREGYELYQNQHCDMIVSVGGGSAHDAAKAVGVMVSHDGMLWEFVGINKLKNTPPPLIAVNTTAGTGSEVTRFAVLTHVEKKTKLTLVDRRLTPLIAVNDPELMVGLTPELTVQTGMDALTHAIEAYLSRIATPLTDACALEAIGLIATHLPRAYACGPDVEARAAMAYAQYLAGLASNNASAGAVHAIAHQLGGLYNLPHGLCNAVLLPWVLEYNLTACMERLGRIGEAMGKAPESGSVRVRAQKAIDVLRVFQKDLGVPEQLGAIGVTEEDLPLIARQAMSDPTVLTNPRRATVSDLLTLLRKAL